MFLYVYHFQKLGMFRSCFLFFSLLLLFPLMDITGFAVLKKGGRGRTDPDCMEWKLNTKKNVEGRFLMSEKGLFQPPLLFQEKKFRLLFNMLSLDMGKRKPLSSGPKSSWGKGKSKGEKHDSETCRFNGGEVLMGWAIKFVLGKSGAFFREIGGRGRRIRERKKINLPVSSL